MALDASGIPLRPEHIREFVLELLSDGRTRKREELMEMVNSHHEFLGGLPTNTQDHRSQFTKAPKKRKSHWVMARNPFTVGTYLATASWPL